MGTNADKLYRKALLDQQRRLKPGECQKYVRIVIDNSFTFSTFGQELLDSLKDVNLNYEIRCIGENCIFWERNVAQREFISNDDLAVCNAEWEMENQVLKLLKGPELKMHIKQRTLSKFCKEFHNEFPEKRRSLVVPRMKDNDKITDHAEAYVELQLLEDIAFIEVIPNVKEIAALLGRFTKAIAEAPYKQQKFASLGSFKKYLANDKKQCVRVVGTMGFGRLWQQHLNRLPQVTLEVAEAIITQYNCPKKLQDTYRDNPKAIEEIADLRLNRINGPQPLQTERRIGNVLSSKLYTLYNSRDPNVCI